MKKLILIVLGSLLFHYANAQLCNRNWVVNGNFENGNAGFGSALIFDCAATAAGDFCITQNASQQNGGWLPIQSQDPGTFYYVADGAAGGCPVVAWSQVVNVVPGFTYTFCFWGINLDVAALANPVLSGNILDNGNNLLATVNTGPLAQGAGWAQFCIPNWVAPPGVNTVTLEIHQVICGGIGNDFGLDNITFAGPYTYDILITSVPCTGGACNGSATATALNPAVAPVTYVWNTTPPTNGQTIVNQCAGTYTVTATDDNGCVAMENVSIGPACPSCPQIQNPTPLGPTIPDQSCWWSTGGNSNSTVGLLNKLGTTNNQTPLRIVTNDIERIRVNGNDGFVGINTTIPANRLEINSAITGTSGLRFSELDELSNAIQSNQTQTVLSVNGAGDVILVKDQQGAGGSSNCGQLNIVTKDDGSGNLVCSQIFDNTVNVGVGTVTPQNKLDVEGALVVGAGFSGTSTAPPNGALIQGQTGIGTATVNAAAMLQVNGNIYSFWGGYYTNDCSNNALPILRNTGDCSSSTLNIGHYAGNNNPTNLSFNRYCVFGGYGAGINVTGVERCTFLGAQAGRSFTTSGSGLDNNTFIGFGSGGLETNGVRNTYVGAVAGGGMNLSSFNTMVGNLAGNGSTLGSFNVFMGDQAGRFSNGNENTFIGTNAWLGAPGGIINNAGLFGANTVICESNTQRFGNDRVIRWGFGRCAENGTTTGFHDDAMTVTANGGVYHLDRSGAMWSYSSDISLKENITDLDANQLLRDIDQLPVTKWNYKADNGSKFHIGPMAQDFHKIFNLNNDETSIYAVDLIGVSLAGVKALIGKTNDQEEKIAELLGIVEQLTNKINEFELALSECCTSFEQQNLRTTESESDNASLGQNVPNPFNENTEIGYYLPSVVKSASINVYTIDGQKLQTFDSLAKGRGSVSISSGVLAPGAYLYNLVADGKQIDSKWMIVTK